MDAGQILDEYRMGSEEKRISLFLSYRDLRDEFSKIEQDREIVHLPGKGVLIWLRWIAGSS